MKRAIARLACCALALLSVPATAAGDPPAEPPGTGDPDVDYVAAPDDSIEPGTVAVGYGLAGRQGRAPGRNRSLRFRGDSLEAGVREGDDDPDGGGDLGARGDGRVLRIGRIAPAWGRGLVVGAAADPWTARDARPADRFGPRARGGDGVWCAWPGAGVELFGVQLGSRAAMGAAAMRDGWRLGIAGARGGASSVTLSTERPDRAAEWAIDARGRWRAEATASRGAGPVDVALRARTGHEGYRSPLAPARATAGHSAALAARAGSRSAEVSGTLAGWRFAPGSSGSRAGLQAAWRDGTGHGLSLGFEEQHGARRARSSAASRATGMRQGVWLEWRGEIPAGALSVRDELWGRLPFGRGRVRRSLGAGVEAALPAGARLGVAHTVFRARAGETVYLPERDSDRWVLRALGGAGDRTRATLRIPLAEGTLQGAVVVGRSHAEARAQWSLQWSRRVRLRRTP